MGAASSRLQEVSTQEPVNNEKRKAMALLDGISGGEGIEAIVSFPGLFQEEWNEIVAMADLMKRLDPDNAFFSTACIFLPDGDPNFGQHYANDIDNDGKCFCHKLYGEKKAWGCKWFDIWRNQVLEIRRRGQIPVVVYKAGQVGEGDDANWADFPIPFTTNRPGLGGSQAGEVALVKVYWGKDFIKRDVKDVSQAIAQASYDKLTTIIRGVQGARKLAAAIKSSRAAQQGLKSLILVAADIGEAGARALAEQLPKLLALERLGLGGNNIGEAGGRAVAEQLPKLSALEDLDLPNNNIGEAGCRAVAEQLPKLSALKGLYLSGNNIGEAGAQALAEQLPKLTALKKLYLGHNNIGEAGCRAVAEQLPKLTALIRLDLGGNNIGEAGCRAVAEQLPKLTALEGLGLGQNNIGEAGCRAVAEQLPKLTALEVLVLRDNNIGEAGEALLQRARPRQLALYL